jgi:hypothetical protein
LQLAIAVLEVWVLDFGGYLRKGDSGELFSIKAKPVLTIARRNQNQRRLLFVI